MCVIDEVLERVRHGESTVEDAEMLSGELSRLYEMEKHLWDWVQSDEDNSEARYRELREAMEREVE